MEVFCSLSLRINVFEQSEDRKLKNPPPPKKKSYQKCLRKPEHGGVRGGDGGGGGGGERDGGGSLGLKLKSKIACRAKSNASSTGF